MTDAIKATVKNTSQFAIPGVGVVDHGLVLGKRWTELSEKTEKEEAQEDTRSATEIASDMWNRIRGEQV